MEQLITIADMFLAQHSTDAMLTRLQHRVNTVVSADPGVVMPIPEANASHGAIYVYVAYCMARPRTVRLHDELPFIESLWNHPDTLVAWKAMDALLWIHACHPQLLPFDGAAQQAIEAATPYNPDPCIASALNIAFDTFPQHFMEAVNAQMHHHGVVLMAAWALRIAAFVDAFDAPYFLDVLRKAPNDGLQWTTHIRSLQMLLDSGDADVMDLCIATPTYGHVIWDIYSFCKHHNDFHACVTLAEQFGGTALAAALWVVLNG